ncbi:TonB-dependent receptor domain-containing protein [Candidatus Sororendozoicomonas aggregata]|uniref:TonB-dependent receptor domain-containing protein n=1 Tax=Candidatus Sororendozoicomonas aggregata TaxID=3073239 RepID=UPI002ED292EC
MKTGRCITCAVKGLLLSTVVLADQPVIELETVTVSAARKKQSAVENKNIQSLHNTPYGELAKDLEAFLGLSTIRKGGRGFDPVLRGQGKFRLNMVLDGGYIQGACPASMDTSSSYVSRQGYDQITVLRGKRGVVNGAGGSGGTVLLERDRPYFTENTLTGTVDVKATTNSEKQMLGTDLIAGSEGEFVRLYGSHEHQGNYKDGKGDKVSSAYTSSSGGIVFGYNLTPDSYLELNYEGVRDRDLLYAYAHPMDVPWANSNTYRIKFEQALHGSVFQTLHLSAYRTDVEHWMDTYTLRERKGYESSVMPMDSKSVSDTWGTTFKTLASLKKTELTVGIDYLGNNSDSYHRMGGPGHLDLGDLPVISLDRPGVETRRVGLFAEAYTQLDRQNTLTTGARLDYFTADATKADYYASGYMGGANPDSLYKQFYDSDTRGVNEINVSGVLGLARQLTHDQQLTVFLSRTVVSADVDQRFRALSMMGEYVVGNPDIKPEKHRQIELGWRKKRYISSMEVVAFYDDVDDYILQYKHIKGSGRQLKKALLYKNIDAELYGIEAVYTRMLSEQWEYRGELAYTHGRNKSDGGALAQIAPLSVTVSLNWHKNQWKANVDWVLAVAQHRVYKDFGAGFDENTELDAGETAGYGVINMAVSYQFSKRLLMNLGVNNLFDKAYTRHLNKRSNDPLNPESTQIMEPGREFYGSVRWIF